MSDARRRHDIALGRTVGSKLVSDHHTRRAALTFEKLSHQTPGSLGIAAALHLLRTPMLRAYNARRVSETPFPIGRLAETPTSRAPDILNPRTAVSDNGLPLAKLSLSPVACVPAKAACPRWPNFGFGKGSMTPKNAGEVCIAMRPANLRRLSLCLGFHALALTV